MARMRKKLSKARSKRLFRKSAGKIHRSNMKRTLMRGGIRF